MLNCKDISRVISESFERPLSFGERAGLRFHMLICGTCRRFRKLQYKIHSAVKEHGTGASQDSDEAPVLPEDSKSRINIAIRKAIEESDKD